ncbi:hypothetical protein HS141_03185 [Cetobacterium somerae]|uniref:hypothetical protein n=1 Tax=Cetobacterium somerae TaxID=188913 RepID=UPI00211E6FD7|nr:hypothetical protein [Cetobacterium somerae]MCQ9625973.1 hypothetical protein [Cetobacterium somerae]WVJ02634.1 hypothetical protein VSU16_11125 [Cetobacterium somerae]
MNIEILAQSIREASKLGKLISKYELEREPLKIKASKIERVIEELKNSEKTKDIDIIRGKTEVYFYSKDYISNTYRDVLFNLKEKNIQEVIIDLVRKESQLYPRPTSLEIFKLSPFNRDDIEDLIDEIIKNKEYIDIKIVEASNGAKYLFSDTYMIFGHAKGLCEWVEVGQFENP